jgi:hypothetical protein
VGKQRKKEGINSSSFGNLIANAPCKAANILFCQSEFCNLQKSGGSHDIHTAGKIHEL